MGTAMSTERYWRRIRPLSGGRQRRSKLKRKRTGVGQMKRSTGDSSGRRQESDLRLMGRASTPYWERTGFTLRSLIETPPLGFQGSPSTFDPWLDTYIHSGLTSLRDHLDYTSFVTLWQCRSCESIFHSIAGSHSGRTLLRRIRPRSRGRRTITTSTASDTSSLHLMTFLILRRRVGLAPLLTPRYARWTNTSTENSNLPQSGLLLVATDP